MALTHVLTDSFIYRLLIWPVSYPTVVRDDGKIQRYLYHRLKENLGRGVDVPRRLAMTEVFLPEWREEASHLNKTITGSRLSYLLTVAELNRTDLKTDNQTNTSYDYGREAIRTIQLLTRLLDDLRAERRVSASDFLAFLQPLRQLDVALYETIAEGIRLYFNDEYLPAAYVLTLQLEDLLRHLVRLSGSQSLEQTRMGIAEKPLGRLFRALKPVLPTNIYHYLFWLLKDYRGLNLRNAIAHGFFKKTNTHPTIVVGLLYAICLLVRQLDKRG